MLFSTVLILFVGAAKSSFSSYEPFSPIQQVSDIGNSLDPIEHSSRRALHTNKIVECTMEDLFQSVGLNELQDLIEGLASKKGTSPFTVLRILYKRMKNKEEMEENIMTAMDGIPITDVLNPPFVEIPPPIRRPPATNRAPYSLPDNIPINPPDGDDTKVVIIPVAQPPPVHKLPTKTDRLETPFNRDNGGPPVSKINHILPMGFPLLSPLKNNHFRPPLGATVRVNSGDPRNPINRDITISVSPFMTILEALRQAETKYQNILGLNHDMDVMTFSHSSTIGCYLVNNINDLETSADFGWKIIITDRESHILYDNFCLPNGKDILVKPGTVISLSYVPL